MFAVTGSRNVKHASCLSPLPPLSLPLPLPFVVSFRSLAYQKRTLSRSHVRIKHSRETIRLSRTLCTTIYLSYLKER